MAWGRARRAGLDGWGQAASGLPWARDRRSPVAMRLKIEFAVIAVLMLVSMASCVAGWL
ncbi:hypothetical protein [Erythrobacter sp. EC-HK427]|uniref:hypothetical protein n=1 Tax=Erythrobacter sp. EC-HK427 TaxID=2038396 RepID=UPI001254A437|nr:hypothetical protein [Erythrobacter sp. EC-HK427]VVT07534.1 hypothetical protein ERY430_41508 [Erythrobacter sp. EC-HK427]